MPKQYIENTDYQLIPSEENEEAWNVRVLEGDYSESVFKINSIRIDDKTFSSPRLSFEYDIVSTPDAGLQVENNEKLDLFIGDLIVSIIESAIERDEAVLKDVK